MGWRHTEGGVGTELSVCQALGTRREEEVPLWTGTAVLRVGLSQVGHKEPALGNLLGAQDPKSSPTVPAGHSAGCSATIQCP